MRLKRYSIVIQHEVIVYAYDEILAQATAIRSYANCTCVVARELPLVENEVHTPILDNRTAPGS